MSNAASFYWHSNIAAVAISDMTGGCTSRTGWGSSFHVQLYHVFSSCLLSVESPWQNCLPSPREAKDGIKPSFWFAIVATVGTYKSDKPTERDRALVWSATLLSCFTWSYYWDSTTFQRLPVGISVRDAWVSFRGMRVWTPWNTPRSSFCFICFLLSYFLNVEQTVTASWLALKLIEIVLASIKFYHELE